MSSPAIENIHIGNNIRRIRELKNIKQHVLASLIGESQQTISKIERTPQVAEATLDRISKALGVSSHAIRVFSENIAFRSILESNQYESQSELAQINSIDKIFELYERLLNSEKEKQKIYEEYIKNKIA
ncbi:MAG: helix-turn-helix transcriptional regulator [Bacteroidetes bacterium]|nr:helix-turn-helix transcriptional regulator [Bacteroidota bacterium]